MKDPEMKLLIHPGKKDIRKAVEELEKETTHQGYCFLDKESKKIFQRFVKMHELVIAGGGLVIREQKLLMIVRLGLWDLPKGKLEKKESFREGAKREVMEECGLKSLELQEKAGVTYHTYTRRGSRKLKRTHWYFATTGQEQLVPQANEGITHAEWLAAAKVEEALKKTYPGIRDMAKTALPHLKEK